MRQRVSLIRTLAYDPQVILMDEPFGALDAQTRMILQAELISIWHAHRKTILFVTHDLAEAVTLAERVILFSQRPGTIKTICEVPFPHPRDPFDLHGTKGVRGIPRKPVAFGKRRVPFMKGQRYLGLKRLLVSFDLPGRLGGDDRRLRSRWQVLRQRCSPGRR